jgi:SAM-dependent methyltransferase
MTKENIASPPPLGVLKRLHEALSWRWRFRFVPWLKKRLGIRDQQWCRVISDLEAERFVRTLPHSSLEVLELSPGSERWKRFGFKSYRSTFFPDYDLCAGPLQREAFDLVIAEQVLEHVHWPYRAVRNVLQMLRPDGWFLVSTPFLLRVHDYPDDCSRWTETGIRHLLMEGGFPGATIRTGSWGNRACVRANFHRFASWIPWWHSLRNEPLFPIVVWAFAQKSGIQS